VISQRLQAPQGVDANHRRVGSQRSTRDRAQRLAAVIALQFLQLYGSTLKLNKSFRGRDRGWVGRGVG
jgi:hypothetical protein